MAKTIGVLGAGQMGNGIAHVFAATGHEVRLYDIAESQLALALRTVEQNLARQVKKGALDAAQVPAVLARIRTTRALADLARCEVVIEAVTENERVKLELFRSLDVAAREDAILATNTSSIPITRIASATRRPEKVVGMHFMNPVPVMKLVEVTRGHATSEATFEAVAGLVAALGKTMAVSQDYPGFIVNRILIPMINEAAFALFEGVASAADIDQGMKLGTNQPMGPLELADFIGLDTVLSIASVLYDGFKDPKYRPCPLLVKLVNAGHLGRKSGRGFHVYR